MIKFNRDLKIELLLETKVSINRPIVFFSKTGATSETRYFFTDLHSKFNFIHYYQNPREPSQFLRTVSFPSD